MGCQGSVEFIVLEENERRVVRNCARRALLKHKVLQVSLEFMFRLRTEQSPTASKTATIRRVLRDDKPVQSYIDAPEGATTRSIILLVDEISVMALKNAAIELDERIAHTHPDLKSIKDQRKRLGILQRSVEDYVDVAVRESCRMFCLGFPDDFEQIEGDPVADDTNEQPQESIVIHGGAKKTSRGEKAATPAEGAASTSPKSVAEERRKPTTAPRQQQQQQQQRESPQDGARAGNSPGSSSTPPRCRPQGSTSPCSGEQNSPSDLNQPEKPPQRTETLSPGDMQQQLKCSTNTTADTSRTTNGGKEDKEEHEQNGKETENPSVAATTDEVQEGYVLCSDGQEWPLPEEGDDWVDVGDDYYWSDTIGLYYCPAAGVFYDGENGMWYDPETDEWFNEDENETAEGDN